MNIYIFLPLMNVRYILYSWFFLFTLVSTAQYDIDILPIDSNTIGETDFLGKHIEYFEENGRTFSIDEVSKKKFISSKKEILNFGYSQKTIWLRFRIKNSSDTPVQKILSIQKSLQDTVQFFYRDQNKLEMLQSGQMISEAQKALPGFSISFPITLKKNSIDTFYLRTVSKYGKSFAIKLLDKPVYDKNEQIELIIACLLIGIFITILIYNFFLARSLKDTIYDFYCASVVGSLSVQLLFRGFLKLFVVDNSPFLQEWLPIFIFCFSGIASSYFCLRFLNTKKYSKSANWALKGSMVLMAIAFLYPFLSFYFFNKYTDARLLGYFAILFSFIAIYAGIVVYKNGNISARFLIYAWSVFCLTIMLYSLASLAIIPANFITMNSYLVGTVLEVFLLSLALGDRYVQLKKERIQLRNDLASQEQTIQHKNEEISSLKLETLQYIKTKQHLTQELKKISEQQEGITIKEVLVNLQADKVGDDKLALLKKDIDTANLEYISKLKATFPNLTKGDIELSSFILLGLTRKEIALIRNTSFDAVKKSIYRFRKKINMKPQESLEDFINSLN